MCILCEFGFGSRGDLAGRTRVLQLLALVEHPHAMPADAALRLGREILVLLGSETGSRRCDPVPPPGPVIAETR